MPVPVAVGEVVGVVVGVGDPVLVGVGEVVGADVVGTDVGWLVATCVGTVTGTLVLVGVADGQLAG